jgi:predicted NUDIX family NTP pyrophosphohydrolase
MKKSAGILVYRFYSGELEVFLVHPGGPFWKNKDDGAWSIPKGEYAEDEDPLEAAKREFEEETGIVCDGKFITLDPIKQKGGKMVSAWALEKHIDAKSIKSNLFSMEWPPKSGKMQEFPEVDKAAWFGLNDAKQKINPSQAALIDQLITKLNSLK